MTVAGLDPRFTNPLGNPTLADTSNPMYTFGINQTTGTFNDPVKMPPLAGNQTRVT